MAWHLDTPGFGHTPPSTPEWCVECCQEGGWRRERRYFFAPTITDARLYAVRCGLVVFVIWQVSR